MSTIQGDPTIGKGTSRAYTERPRRIPPELARDELLELGCGLLAALLYYRVIAAADDQGRLPADPRYIRSVLFGMREEITSKKVEAALLELDAAGFLILYQEEGTGRKLLQVASWWDLQGPWARRAYASSYPAPAGWRDRVFMKPSDRYGADDGPADVPQGADQLPADVGNGAGTNTVTVTVPITATNTDKTTSPVKSTGPGTNTSTGTAREHTPPPTNGGAPPQMLVPSSVLAELKDPRRPLKLRQDMARTYGLAVPTA